MRLGQAGSGNFERSKKLSAARKKVLPQLAQGGEQATGMIVDSSMENLTCTDRGRRTGGDRPDVN